MSSLDFAHDKGAAAKLRRAVAAAGFDIERMEVEPSGKIVVAVTPRHKPNVKSTATSPPIAAAKRPRTPTSPRRVKKPKYVNEFRDQTGKVRCYFRRPGRKAVSLPGVMWSTEFMDAYAAALRDTGAK